MQFAMHETGWAGAVLEAYERLIYDAARGDRTLFTTAEGIERLWEVSTPLLENPPVVRPYPQGSWGPNRIHQLIAPHVWRLPFERTWRDPNTTPSEGLAALPRGGLIEARRNTPAPMRCTHRYGYCPEPDPERRQLHPAARLRRLPGPAGGHREDHRPGLRGRLPPHRHRADVRQRGRRRRGDQRLRPRPRASCSSPASSTTASTSPTRPARPSTRRSPPSARLRRPVPDPLAAADAVRRRLRLHLEDADRVPEGRSRPLHRRLELPARAPRAPGRRDRRRARRSTRSRSTPTSPTTPRRTASHDAGILVEAWSPIAQGGVLDDDVISAIADEVGKTPAQVTLRWHVQRGDIIFPKSSSAGADGGELRALRLRARPTRRSRRSARSTRARTAAPAPTPTSSTTSPTEVTPQRSHGPGPAHAGSGPFARVASPLHNCVADST